MSHYIPAAAYLIAAGTGSIIAILSRMPGLQRYRTVDVVPATFALPIFLPTVLGLLIFNHHWSTSAYAGGPIGLGAALLALGTLVLSRA